MANAALNRVWTEIILPEDVRTRVEEAFGGVVEGAEGPYRSVLLTGEAGCGKSALVRCLAQETGVALINAGFHWVLKPPPTGTGDGDRRPEYERNLDRIFADARVKAPSVLFFDETEVLFASPEATGANAYGAVRNSRTPELVRCYLAEVDRMRARGDRVLVAGATFEPFGIDVMVRRSFDVEIELPFPDESARRRILELALDQFQVGHTVPEMVVTMTTGRSGRYLTSLARDVCVAAATASGTIEPDTWIHAIRSKQ